MGNIKVRLEILDDLESRRKIIKFLMILSVVLFCLITISIFLLLFNDNDFYSFRVLGYSFVIPLGFFNWGMRNRKHYARMFKGYVIEDNLKSVFSDLIFEPDYGLPEEAISSTGMMHMGNRYFSEDYISGHYKDVPFEQADVCIQNHQDTGKSSVTVTYFRGRWMIFRFNKEFVCDLQIRERGFSYAKKTGGFFSLEEKMIQIELENEEFNNVFKVFAQNEEEAYYILTPQIMQSIIDLQGKTKGKLMLCFVNNRLHVACNSGKSAFEPPIFSKIDIQEIQAKAYEEINLITRFVDDLNLDRKLFRN